MLNTAPAEPLPVVKVTNPRGGGFGEGWGEGGGQRWCMDSELSTLWSTWGINDSNATNETKSCGYKHSDAECSGAEMWTSNIIKIPNNTQATRNCREFYTPSFNVDIKTWNLKKKVCFASVSPLNEQPCRKGWRGGEEALQKVDKTHTKVRSRVWKGDIKYYVCLSRIQMITLQIDT